MKKYIVKGTSFTFNYPDDWEIEDSGNVVSVYEPKRGAGALQFSYYIVENPETIVVGNELKEYVEGKYGNADIIADKVRAYCDITLADSKAYWRFWMFLIEKNVIFATYNCSLDARGSEDEIVNKIVESSVAGVKS